MEIAFVMSFQRTPRSELWKHVIEMFFQTFCDGRDWLEFRLWAVFRRSCGASWAGGQDGAREKHGRRVMQEWEGDRANMARTIVNVCACVGDEKRGEQDGEKKGRRGVISSIK